MRIGCRYSREGLFSDPCGGFRRDGSFVHGVIHVHTYRVEEVEQIDVGQVQLPLIKIMSDVLQCVVERAEARDLVDILAVIRSKPSLEDKARLLLRQQDAVLVVERLLAWSDADIDADLEAYDDVSRQDAQEARDLLLKWTKEANSGRADG